LQRTDATKTKTTNEREAMKATIRTPVQVQHTHPTETVTTNDTTTSMNKSSKAVFTFGAKCTCGKVEVAIETLEKAPPVRMVCYCSDCRGYYESLDRIAIEKGLPPSGILDVSSSRVVLFFLINK
jgi:hypothetical protein